VPAAAVPRAAGVASERLAPPAGSTRLSVWLGAVPVIVAAAVPDVTVPIVRLFAGPAAPVAPAAETLTPMTSPFVATTDAPLTPLTVTVTLTATSP
jgi:hypothetical protein